MNCDPHEICAKREAALRKMVEELEQKVTYFFRFKDARAEGALLWKERAEKAEAKLAEAYTQLSELKQGDAYAKLQADLGAALLVCEVLGVQYGRAWLSEQAREAGERVRQLLADREAKRG